LLEVGNWVVSQHDFKEMEHKYSTGFVELLLRPKILEKETEGMFT
jgi:hypothetical protein